MQSVVSFLKLQFTPSPPASCPPPSNPIWFLLIVSGLTYGGYWDDGWPALCENYILFSTTRHTYVFCPVVVVVAEQQQRKSHDSVPERRGIFNPELLGEQVLPNNSFVSSTVVLDSWAGIEKVHCLQIRCCCCCTFLGWLCLGLGGLIECVCCFESWLRWPPPEKGFIDVVW